MINMPAPSGTTDGSTRRCTDTVLQQSRDELPARKHELYMCKQWMRVTRAGQPIP